MTPLFTGTGNELSELPCPYALLRSYSEIRGGFMSDTEPFFVFADRSPVMAKNMCATLHKIINLAGFDAFFYETHSLRAGRSGDLYKMGIPIEIIKKLGRWKSNAVFRHLKTV